MDTTNADGFIGAPVPIDRSAPTTVPHSWSDPLPGPLIRVEESHENGDIILRAHLPDSVPERDIDVRVRDGVLRIHAERTRQQLGDDGSSRTELYSGSFTRSIPLAEGVDTSDVIASYADGVLQVRAPIEAFDAASHAAAERAP